MNKHNNKIYIDRLFPNVNELKLHNKLKINRESIMYITIPQVAEQITKIITYHTLKYFTNCAFVTITDATAGVGGNTISFSQKFKHINAIEIDQERFNYLSNNINAYRIDNISLYNDDCLDILPQLNNHHVIFIDPPWGGRNYKNHNKIRLHLNNFKIEDICLDLLDTEKMTCVPNLIIMKLPKNYDIQYIYAKFKRKICNIYFYELNKMIIIIIENGYYSLPSPPINGIY